MKRPGQCRNGGCERLATIVVTIPGLGDRALCWHCHQALNPMFGSLRVVRQMPVPVSAA